ncbi:unnamed protein product [Symbiodinium sp. CCMP2456]|nr:unnamed protein product [Symbiodinium sp. CCMP2456]
MGNRSSEAHPKIPTSPRLRGDPRKRTQRREGNRTARFGFQATRDSQKSCRLKRPFETLETAFQVTCQVMIALLSPRVHPWMRRLSACLRSYPEVLPSPAFSVLVSGFHAKLVLDV